MEIFIAFVVGFASGAASTLTIDFVKHRIKKATTKGEAITERKRVIDRTPPMMLYLARTLDKYPHDLPETKDYKPHSSTRH